MAAVRTNVALQLGTFFRVTTNVQSAVDDDDKEVSFRMVCQGLPDVPNPDPKAIAKVPTVPHPEHPKHVVAGVKQLYKCPECSNTDKATFHKASQSGSTFSIVTAEAIAGAQIGEELKQKIDLHVHRAADLVGTTMPGGKAYFLECNKGEESVYSLFRRMVQDLPELAFVAVWASRSKPALYQLGTFGQALTIQQIAWPSSIRVAPAADAPFSETDLGMAKMIANGAVSDYDPAAYKDGRKESLLAEIAKAEGVEGLLTGDSTTPSVAATAAGSLTAMLQAQVAAMALTAPEPEAPKKRAPRKKAPAKTAA